MNIIWFLIKEGFKGLARSKYAGVFSIIIIAIALILLGLGYVAARDTLFLVESIRSQFDVDIFLHKTATDGEVKEFANLLDSMTEIQSFEYISSEDAAVKFKEEFGENILDILDYNPLPPSFTVSLKPMYRNLVSVESISAILSKEPIVDEIKYRKQFLILLERYQRIILAIVLVVFTFLTVIAIVLSTNSIKMTIFSRRDVISAMRLVGATDSFIKAPFIIEGTLQGLLGAGISSLIIYILFYVLNNYMQSIIEYKAVVSYQFYITLLILGCIMGLIGSARAIKKFLK
jgi:cell division transport system permease protein